MSLQTYMFILVFLGFTLGVLCTQLVRYAGEYVARISAGRIAAMRAHPAGGRGNLHVGTIHVPRSRTRDNDDWLERYMREAEADWAKEDQPLPIKVPAQQDRRSNWEFPMECSE